jgi:predicted alpha/beta hydrolase
MKEVVRVLARDGYELSGTWFIADDPNEKVILINSATGVKQGYYADFAAFLAKQGFNVYTYDYRGIGASRPSNLSNLICDMKDWAKDMDAMIGNITRFHSSSQLIILGHSVGGQLIGMGNLSRQADAMIMISSQTPYWKNYGGGLMRIKLLMLWYVLIPSLTKIFGYFPSSSLGLFEDLPRRVARQWARWAKSPEYFTNELPSLKSSFERLDQKTLMISFADDDLAPYKAVIDLKKYYPRLKFDHRHYTPEDVMQQKVGHFGFFKKRTDSALWQELGLWINQALPAHSNRAA